MRCGIPISLPYPFLGGASYMKELFTLMKNFVKTVSIEVDILVNFVQFDPLI